ncbi:hypothetical protein [Escherichia coli]|nr:hypothetical protein [Escherichia coli]MDV0510389.1 hypothetical protein [Escherichia coli]MDV1492362.1 hypothetical protein [Escherichia coli]MDV1513267.1 hypothetical protein [Escherichia coli]MDV1602870.1 hypothetical protein [Escherichia coli]
MKKKNRPVQQAANSDIRTSDITPTTSPVQVPREGANKSPNAKKRLCK